MSPDQIKKAFDKVDEGIAALQAFSVLMIDGRHSQTEMQEIGQVIAFMQSAISDRVDLVREAFDRDVLPFYRDFQQAKIALRGKVTA
ncbi:hypothetical protein [Cupriavidus pauculus]|uniref:hypothetical protein n=1 Tax=Cupriavidus pauculus TaxID=82633 RepID=UPI003857DE4C